jgi:hypothetical protein
MIQSQPAGKPGIYRYRLEAGAHDGNGRIVHVR